MSWWPTERACAELNLRLVLGEVVGGALSEPEGSSISCSHRACGEIWCEFVRRTDCTRVYVILCECTVCVRVQVMLLGCVEFYLNLSGSSSGFR